MNPIPALLHLICCLVGTAIAGERQAGPLFHEAAHQFATMKTTLYQHKTEVDRQAGSYKYDCVRFVSYAMRQVTPLAWKRILLEMKIGPGRIPSPPSFQKFFARLTTQPQPGWESVDRAADLRPGDIVSWDYKTERASGHAVIIADLPKRNAAGDWEVLIYDATSTPHAEDSRPGDERAQIFEVTGRRSGLGRGVMAFTADPTTGTLTGYRWKPSGKIILCPIGAGRPLE